MATSDARQAAESYLGRPMTDTEYDQLLRATYAEADPGSQAEAAMVAASILNRTAASGGTITDTLMAPYQFESVTGTNGRAYTPSPNFRDGPSASTRDFIEGSYTGILPAVSHKQTDFTAAQAEAYAGPGHDLKYFKYATDNYNRVGGSLFNTALPSAVATKAAAATQGAFAPPRAASTQSAASRGPSDLSGIADTIKSGDIIAKGSSGKNVEELQHFLNEHGITDARGQPLAEDGIFGNRTREALKEYQSTHPELVVDGKLGPRTMAAMAQDAQEGPQPATVQQVSGTASDTPRILSSTAVTDPVTEAAQQQQAAQSGWVTTGPQVAPPAPTFTPPSYVASNIGTNLANYMANPEAFGRSVGAAAVADNLYPGATQAAFGFGYHPGESQDATPASRVAFNELSSDRLPQSDPYRMGVPVTSAATNVNTGLVVYNAASAFARQIIEGRPEDAGPVPLADQPQLVPVVDTPETPPAAGGEAPQASSGDAPGPLSNTPDPNDPADIRNPPTTETNREPDPTNPGPAEMVTPASPGSTPLHDESSAPFGAYESGTPSMSQDSGTAILGDPSTDPGSAWPDYTNY